ncbi:MAG: rod shape-determining protein MreD [Eubacteriales bacterium]|nr:rod shape-determining protein MreD [Eubacteriales bacterium]
MKNVKIYRYLAYSLEILLLFILGSTPSLLPAIYGATPCLLISVAITIAVFESEVVAMIFGLVCGVLTDIGFSNSIGTFTIALTIVCFVIGFGANNFITITFTNMLLGTVVIVSAVLSLHFLISYVLKGYDNGAVYFVNHYISRIVQTIITTALLYFVNKFVYTTLNE